MKTVLRQASRLTFLACAALLAFAPSARAQFTINSGPNFGTWSIGMVDGVSLAATGGAPPYRWTIVDNGSGGLLPPGLSIRTDIASYQQSQVPTPTAEIAGVALTAGTYSFRLRVTDSLSAFVDKDVTMQISNLLLLDSFNLPDANVGSLYSQQLHAIRKNNLNADPVSPTWALSSVTPPSPAWLSINGATGVLSGTPTAAGFYTAWINVTEGGETITRNVNIAVYDVHMTSPTLLPNGTQGVFYQTTVTAAGGTGPYTFTATGLPIGLSMTSGGILSGTTTQVGPFRIVITATDSSASSHSRVQNATLDIVGSPKMLPYFPSPAFLGDAVYGWPFSNSLGISGGGTAPFTYSAAYRNAGDPNPPVAGLPAGLSIRAGDDPTGQSFLSHRDAEIWGVPVSLGLYEIFITVTDADAASMTTMFPLRVGELIVSNNDNNNWTRGVAGDKKLRVLGGSSLPAYGGDAPDGATLYSVVPVTASPAPPAGIVLSTGCSQALAYCGMPSENGSFGTRVRFTRTVGPAVQMDTSYSFSVGGGSSTIQINTFSNLGFVTTTSAFALQLTACCTTNSLAWSFAGGAPPAGLSINASTGLLSAAAGMATGTYTFEARAADSVTPTNYGQKQFTLVVTNNNITSSTALPFGNVGVAYGPGGAGVQLTSTAGGSWTLNYGNVMPPGLSLSSGGLISGTPAYAGQFRFALTVTGGASFTFGLSVYPAGATPPVNWTFSNQGPFPFGTRTIGLSGASGGSGTGYVFSLAPSSGSIPGMRVQNGAPLPTSFGATTAGLIGVLTQVGSFPITIRVEDAADASNFIERSSTLIVSPLHILSQFNLPKARWGAAYTPFMLEPTGLVGAALWSATGLPSGMSINAGDGTLSGTPTGGAATATNSVNVTLTDSATSQSIVVPFSLVINGYDILPASGTLPLGTVNSVYPTQTFALFPAAACSGTCTWSATFSGTGTSPTALFNPSAGTFGGIAPTANFSGTMTVTRSDGARGSVSKICALQIVNATPQTLVFTAPAATIYATVGNVFSTTLSATGGSGSYAWTLDGLNPLPPGLAIYAAGDLISGTLSPSPQLAGHVMAPGTYTFTLKATDTVSSVFVTRTITLISSTLNESYGSLPLSGSITLNNSYSQALLGLGGSAAAGMGNYSWAANGLVPYGLTLTSGGVLSGTPLEAGVFNVPVQLTDTVSTATIVQNVSVTVSGSPAVTFGQGSTSPGTIQQGTSFSQSLTFGGGTTPYNVTAVTPLPPGLTLVTGDARLSGNPTDWFLVGNPLNSGTFTYTLRVQDSAGSPNVSYRTFTVVIAPFTLGVANGLPDAAVGRTYAQTLHTWDALGPATWSVASGTSLPPGLTLASNVLSGTPTLANNSYSFTLTATDASGIQRNQSFTLRVSSVAIADPQMLPVGIIGEPYSYQFADPGAAVTWFVGGVPAGMNFDPATRTFSGEPTNLGTSTLNVTATPAGGVAHSRRFVFLTRFPNPTVMDTQLANTALIDASVGQVASYGLPIPFGGVPPYSWALAPGQTLPPGMILTQVSSLGSPIPNTIIGATANVTTSVSSTLLWGVPATENNYAFDLVATDSAAVPNTVRRTFTLHVSSLSLLGARGIVTTSPYAFQFTAVGGTPPYTYTTSATSPTQDAIPPGFTPVSSGGLWQGTTSSTGNYVFNLTVTDGAGKTFKRRYSVNSSNTTWFVSSTNPPDVWVGSGRRSLLPLNVAGSAPPAAGWTFGLAPGSAPLPPGIAIWTDPEITGCAASSGCINGAALAGQPGVPGTYTFTMRASENAPGTNFADHTFKWRVSPMQIVSPPVGAFVAPNLPAGHVGVPYTTTIETAGGVPPYHYVQSPFVPLPAGMTLSDTGVVSGTPGTAGQFSVAPIITDSATPTPNVLNGPALVLVVTPPGVPPPLAFLTTSFRNDASVGVAYAFSGDFLLRGGTAPFAWSVHSGSTLAPGISLVAGGNGVPDHLVGIPTTAGDYAFDLDVVDATGQTLTLHAGLRVSTVAVTPDTLPPGKIGVPYSATLTPSGGTAPYFFIAHPNWDFPPGVTLSDSGVLSGTPTAPGNFPMIVVAIDQGGSGQELFKLYRFAVDNNAGEAPAVSLSPTPIQVYQTIGSPNPAPIPVAVNTTSDDFGYRLALEGFASNPGMASLSSTSGTAPGATNLTLDLSAVSAGTYSGVLAVSADSVNLLDQIPVTITVANAPPCTYAVSPTSGSTGAAGGPGGFNVTAGTGCAWTATPDPGAPWISISGASSGTGSGPVNFSVAPNAGTDPRDGTIDVQGQTYKLTQFGSSCAFAINPTAVNAPAGGGSATVNITASTSDPGCTWTASSADGLGVNPAAAPAPGSGLVEITIPANGIAAPRDLHALIAGIDFVVHQASAACDVSLSPLEAAAASGGTGGSVSVTPTPGCGYDTTSGPSWVTITSGASGNAPGTLVYEVQPNSTTAQRIGTLTIGGKPFKITQDPLACSVTVDTGSLGSPFGKDGGLVGSIGVVANGANCAWVAGSAAGWAHLSKASGSGSDTINVTADSNASSTTPRSGDLTVAGQVIGIAQSGLTCNYNLQSDSGSLPGVGGLGTVGVIAPSACTWSVISNDLSWLTILSSGSQGTANILFSGLANPSTSASRPGTLSIRDENLAVVKTYTVTQGPAPCTYTLSSSSDTANGSGETKSFGWSATNACTPAAVSYANWLTNVTTDVGTVQYTVQPNPTTFSRKGTIQVGDQTFTVTQSSGTCGYSLNAYGVSFGKTGGSGILLAGQNGGACPATPVIGVTQPFITLINLTGGPPSQWSETYAVAVYNSLTATIRKGQIVFGGQLFTVKQTSW